MRCNWVSLNHCRDISSLWQTALSEIMRFAVFLHCYKCNGIAQVSEVTAMLFKCDENWPLKKKNSPQPLAKEPTATTLFSAKKNLIITSFQGTYPVWLNPCREALVAHPMCVLILVQTKIEDEEESWAVSCFCKMNTYIYIYISL